MCGICGYLNLGSLKPIDKDILRKMCKAISHRGPDDFGTYVDKNVGLGMQRLSVIDLETGHQPIHNEDSSMWIICNGEIYNFPELRKDLIKQGHQFYTQSDTETILHLYEDHGHKCVDYLDGMFAFCIWDGVKKRLFFARDRMGKKPLHYAIVDGHFIFASEIKSILMHPVVRREVDYSSLKKYLVYGYIPAPNTIYKNIKKLPPAEYLILDIGGDLWKKQYWSANYSLKLKQIDEEALIGTITNTLREAVKKRLISDVPLGVFLSGGIDSSLVVALMSQLVPSHQIDAFSIGFEETRFDESRYAKMVANGFGIKHHLEMFSSEKISEAILQVLGFLDEPIADPSIVPTYLLSQYTSGYVKVALSGDGGDELFAGYPKYSAHRVMNFFERFSILGKMEACNSGGLIAFLDRLGMSFKLKKFIQGLSYPSSIRNQLWIGPFSPAEADSILSDGIKEQISDDGLFEEIEMYLRNFDGNDLVDEMLYLDSKLTLQDLYLVKVDRASMACSLEVRSPFLDKSLVELAAAIPSSLKVRRFRGKYILKRAAEEILPKEVVYRPKMGFGIPLSKWLKTELKDFVTDVLSKEEVEKIGVFNYRAVEELLRNHFGDKNNNSIPIWALLMFQQWFSKFGFN